MANEKIIVDFYHGADGPTIIIVINTDELFAKFNAVVESVKSKGEANLDGLDFVQLHNINRFRLSYQERRSAKNVSVDKHGNVTWFFDAPYWDNCIGLIEGFLDGLPGHQYLCYEEAIIELSFKENLRPT